MKSEFSSEFWQGFFTKKEMVPDNNGVLTFRWGVYRGADLLGYGSDISDAERIWVDTQLARGIKR